MIRAWAMRHSLHSSTACVNVPVACSTSSRETVSGSSSRGARTSSSYLVPESAKLHVDSSWNEQPEFCRSRRQALSGLLLCSTVSYLTQCQASQEVLAAEAAEKEVAGAARKDESVFEGLKSLFDPNETTKSGKKLPKAYLKSARGVVTKLRDSFIGDSKNESQFRRNADSAKEAIRDYVANWRGSKEVATEESYQALEKALRVLGEFYSKQGPRAVLPEDVRSRVLESLQTADENL